MKRVRKRIVKKPKSRDGGVAFSKLRSIVSEARGIDVQFLLAVYILLAFGLLMVFSASSPSAYASEATGHDSFYYFKRQFLWAVLGSIGMFVAASYDYQKLKKWAFPALCFSVILLIMVLIPAFGRKINDARRWIYIGPVNFQPSEVAKITMIVFFAYSLSKNYKELKNFGVFLLYIAIIGIVAVIIMMEPHFSCTMLIVATCAIMLFVAGARIWHFLILCLPVIPVLILVVWKSPYRLARVLSFLDPFADIQGSGWQVVQSLYAIGSGGLFGVGMGQSRQKYLNIPEPHNDFIFSILAEEFGLLGVIIVVLMFIFLISRGIKIALKAPDLFGTLLATGIIAMIAIQALVNIAVVTSTIPVTGMPLPFFSYGGTALAITMTEMGIVLNISKNSRL